MGYLCELEAICKAAFFQSINNRGCTHVINVLSHNNKMHCKLNYINRSYKMSNMVLFIYLLNSHKIPILQAIFKDHIIMWEDHCKNFE